MVEGAFDINEIAWDPSRDSANERLSLLAELDAITVAHASQLLDPALRTFGGERWEFGARSCCSVAPSTTSK